MMTGRSTLILSKRILNSSMLCGMMVGSISLLSSMIICNSVSINALNDSMFASTKLLFSKYRWMMMRDACLFINDTSIEHCIFRCRAVSLDLYHVSNNCIEVDDRRIFSEHLRQLFDCDPIRSKNFLFLFFI